MKAGLLDANALEAARRDFRAGTAVQHSVCGCAREVMDFASDMSILTFSIGDIAVSERVRADVNELRALAEQMARSFDSAVRAGTARTFEPDRRQLSRIGCLASALATEADSPEFLRFASANIFRVEGRGYPVLAEALLEPQLKGRLGWRAPNILEPIAYVRAVANRINVRNEEGGRVGRSDALRQSSSLRRGSSPHDGSPESEVKYEHKNGSALSDFDEAIVKADLMSATRQVGLSERAQTNLRARYEGLPIATAGDLAGDREFRRARPKLQRQLSAYRTPRKRVT
jgi:hypothetical protein